ncbi:pectinesterase inhibitor 3-like, partial [Phalaenopsis equestris]|uniref:pectinesterase inhibitor 3-like n=1 Tax=Phalaenopsis equestris TaxID=78828 RepID=UPI0009E3CCA5
NNRDGWKCCSFSCYNRSAGSAAGSDGRNNTSPQDDIITPPPLCRDSLSSYSSKARSSSEQLAHAAVSASLAQTKSALAAISSMAESVAPLKPGESVVLRDCLMTMRDSVQKLQKSRDGMGGGREWAENARTWVSAALTEDNMCADELQNVDLGGKRDAIRELVLRAARLTSKALALIPNVG